MTASLPLLPAADDFNCPTSSRVSFQELAQIWATTHSLLLDHICGTTYLSTYVIRTYSLGVPPVTEDAAVCGGQWHRVTVLLERLISSHLHYITLHHAWVRISV